jgi:hypothetical protein
MFVTNLHFKTTHVSAKVRKGCYKLIIQQPDVLVELVVLGAQQYVELVPLVEISQNVTSQFTTTCDL